jgi:hypothetical protein
VRLHPPVDRSRPSGHNVSMSITTTKSWHCDACGYEWLWTAKAPLRCASCRSRRWNDTDVRRTGTAEAGPIERKGNCASVPALRKAKSAAKRLHPVQPLRNELAQGRGPDQGCSTQPRAVSAHEGHQTWPYGTKRYCADCQSVY